jgi:hypothetical protein
MPLVDWQCDETKHHHIRSSIISLSALGVNHFASASELSTNVSLVAKLSYMGHYYKKQATLGIELGWHDFVF